MPAYLDLLKNWMAVNSFTANREGVLIHTQQLTEAFTRLGFRVADQETAATAQSVHLGLIGGAADTLAPTVGLITHLDTVFTVEEETLANFRWTVEGDRVYGPGANDIKGGTAMIWLVLSTLQEFYPEVFHSTRWVLLANAAEERLAPDFHPFCVSHLGPATRACLVFEAGADVNSSSEFPLVVARKGRSEWCVHVEGRAAHAGADIASGANAVVQAAHLIPRLAALADPARELSVNIASLRGGALTNCVPAHARIVGESRAFAPAVLEQMAADMRRLCASVGTDVPVVRSQADGLACRATFEVSMNTQTWSENINTDALWGVWKSAATDLGMKVSREHRGGLSDGNRLSAVYPTLDGLGPAGGNSHCSERSADGSKLPEYLVISSIAPKALLNIEALVRLLTAPARAIS